MKWTGSYLIQEPMTPERSYLGKETTLTVILSAAKNLAKKRSEILRFAQNDRIDVSFHKQLLMKFTAQHDKKAVAGVFFRSTGHHGL